MIVPRLTAGQKHNLKLNNVQAIDEDDQEDDFDADLK